MLVGAPKPRVGGPYGESMGSSDEEEAWPRAECEVRGGWRGDGRGVTRSLHCSASPSASASAASRWRSASTSSSVVGRGGGEPEPS